MGSLFSRTPKVKETIHKVDKICMSLQALLDYIGRYESRGRYDIVHGKSQKHFMEYSFEHFNRRFLNQLTVDEVLQWQRENINNGPAYSAAGKYQIIRKTLKDLIEKHDIDTSKLYDADMQDRLAIKLLKRRGLTKFLKGQISLDKFQDNLAYEWASLKNSKGRGWYDGDSVGNHAHSEFKEFRGILKTLGESCKT